MRYWSKPFALWLVVALVTPVVPLPRASDPSDWNRVQALPLPARVAIRLHDGRILEGSIVAVHADDLLVQLRRTVRNVARSEVAEIREPPRTGLNKAAGLVAGAIGGAYVGTRVGSAVGMARGCRGCPLPGLRETILGFLFGMLSGAVLGVKAAARDQGVLVYESPPPPSVSAAAAPS
jgi:hypothetical protein